MELLEYYDVTIQYHPGETNFVVDVLWMKAISASSVTYLKVLR